MDEDSQESPTAKTCSSYEKKTGQNKKIPKKQRRLLKQVPTRKPTRKREKGKGATWTPPAARYHSPLEDEPKKNSAKRDGEKRGVGSFGAQGLHHARHPVESRKNGEGLTCPGLSSTKPGWAQFHITAQSVPVGDMKKMVTCGGLASRRGDDGGGRGPGGT